MNPIITFPHSIEPALKLPRASAEKWAETLAEERRRLQEDQEALREREENLREYETRLRTLQAEIEASRAAPAPVHAHSYAHTSSGNTHGTAFLRPSSRTPFHDDPALQAAWEKLHRAREILEAEQVHLRDDRIAVREQLAAAKLREQALIEREAQLREREAIIVDATPPEQEPEQVVAEPTRSAVTRLTLAPFNMARSVFSAKRDK
jgi:hypothetical protein